MKKLNIESLIENSVDTLSEDLSNVWNELLQEVQSYLDLSPISNVIYITFGSEPYESPSNNNEIFQLGVKRIYQNDETHITISTVYLQFLPIILLREAYKCFIPQKLHHNEIVNIFINQKVEIDLEKLAITKEWNSLFREKMVTYDFLAAELNRLDKFLRRDSSELFESPFQYFMRFARQNVQIIGESKEGFYDLFYRDYAFRSSRNLFSKDIIETVRVIIEIFYKVQKYSELLKYQKHFKKLKTEGIIHTELSERSFRANMRWLKNHSELAPNYQVNWLALDIISVLMVLRFNPFLKDFLIDSFLKEFPFFIFQRRTHAGFSLEVIGYCLLPRDYYDDLLNFINKLKDLGYILQAKCFVYDSFERTLNLNYFIESGNKKALINPFDSHYKKDLNIKFRMDYFPKPSKENESFPVKSLSLLEWLLIDRIRFVSITGFGFERKDVALRTLKSDLIDEVLSQRNLITALKTHLGAVVRENKVKEQFLQFLRLNQTKGFFSMRDFLRQVLRACSLITDFLDQNSSIRTLIQLQTYLVESNYHISPRVEDSLLFNRSEIEKILFRDLLPLYFSSKELYIKKVEELQSYYDVILSCQALKIFSPKFIRMIINDPHQVDRIFNTKEQKLKEFYEGYKDYKITNALVEQIIDQFLEEGIIKPTAISTFYHPIYLDYRFIIKYSNTNKEKLDTIVPLFPCFINHYSVEVNERESYLFFETDSGFLEDKARSKLVSFLYTLFKGDIIYFARYMAHRIENVFSRRDFYDLEQNTFFYTPDLFSQFFLFTRDLFGNSLKPLPELSNEIPNKQLELLWSREDNLPDLIEFTGSQISRNNLNLNIHLLSRLSNLHLELSRILLDSKEYQEVRDELFFQNYIKSIKFFPMFQSFGLGQYFLYFYPTDLNEIDFKLLCANFFQKIKYNLRIANSNLFLIKFLSPYRNPGIKPYINWLTKSKRIIREYCLLLVKKVYCILHFNSNLQTTEWDLDPHRFKTHIQNVLFKPKFMMKATELREYNIGEQDNVPSYGSNSNEFKMLSSIYNWHSLDIKLYFGTKKQTAIDYLTSLLKKKLIFPYLSLKNLGLYEKMYIILPNVKKEYNEKLLMIFNFFNYGYIYELEGEYYIHGFKEEISFENGFMVKLYLPECHLDELVDLFRLVFHYLQIDYHLILPDLADGEQLLKLLYGDLDFEKLYSPLTNFIWNDIDKIWMNHKLFTQKFEPIYPSLFYGKESGRDSVPL